MYGVVLKETCCIVFKHGITVILINTAGCGMVLTIRADNLKTISGDSKSPNRLQIEQENT